MLLYVCVIWDISLRPVLQAVDNEYSRTSLEDNRNFLLSIPVNTFKRKA